MCFCPADASRCTASPKRSPSVGEEHCQKCCPAGNTSLKGVQCSTAQASQDQKPRWTLTLGCELGLEAAGSGLEYPVTFMEHYYSKAILHLSYRVLKGVIHCKRNLLGDHSKSRKSSQSWSESYREMANIISGWVDQGLMLEARHLFVVYTSRCYIPSKRNTKGGHT